MKTLMQVNQKITITANAKIWKDTAIKELEIRDNNNKMKNKRKKYTQIPLLPQSEEGKSIGEIRLLMKNKNSGLPLLFMF